MKNKNSILLFVLTLSCIQLFSQLHFTKLPYKPFEYLKQATTKAIDLNNNGFVDFFIAGKKDGVFYSRVYMNLGNGYFSKKSDQLFGNKEPINTYFLDLNNDSLTDIAILYTNQSGNQQYTSYINQGNGTFTNKIPWDPSLYHSPISTFGDIDLDGDIDVLLTEYAGNHLLINDGLGNFSEHAGLGIWSPSSAGVCFGDLDNDGDIDIVVSGLRPASQSNDAQIYLNDGNLNFARDSNNLRGLYDPQIWIEDFNQNGFNDILIVGNEDPFTNYSNIALNDGNGNLTPNLTYTYNVDFALDMKVYDFDNDGFLDVLKNNQAIFTNSGNQFIGPKYSFPSYNIMACGDVDGDADIDVIAYDSKLETISIYRNDYTTGILKTEALNEISIYPNPTTGTNSINLPSNTNTTIKIFNSTGQLIFQQTDIESDTYKFNFNAPSGIYIVEVNSDETKQQFKLIKN